MANENWYTKYESTAHARAIHSINILPLTNFNVEDDPFLGYNTWDHWHLIPSSRPVVNPPEKKRTTVDVPGGDGIIDDGDLLRGFPVYSVRQGSWEFYVDNDWGYWESRRSYIADSIHGLQCRITLDDDPGYYYEGLLSINEWKSNKDRSVIVIDYELGPYKYSWASSANEDWLWDPFNFETDWIYSNTCGIVVNKPNDDWLHIHTDKRSLGRKPLSPVFYVEAINQQTPVQTIYVKLSNPELGIKLNDFNLGAGLPVTNGTKVPNFTLSTINDNNVNDIYLKGVGKVTIDFTVGRL